MSAILFSTMIGPVSIDCVISEKPESVLDITEIPVESGSRISDHAVVAPKKLSLEIANNNVADSYRALVEFQTRREPFTIVTGLDVFNNMLIKRISVERDAMFSRVMRASVDLQEVIIVETAFDANAVGRGKSKTKAKTPGAGNTSGATRDKSAQTANSGDTGGNAPTARNQSILDGLKEKYAGP